METDLIAEFSHEIRHPLHAISGLADVLADKVATDPSLAELADGIREQSDYLSDLLTVRLDAARPGSPAVATGRPELIDVGDIARRCVERWRANGSVASGVEVVFDGPDGPVDATGDRLGLRQIVDNLIHNALKFTSSGEVRVTVRRREPNVEITVADTGCGIAADELDRIFVRFHQLATTPTADGVGLGLAIVSALAAGMGASISVDSRLGEGTALTLTLAGAPLGSTAAANRTATPPRAAASPAADGPGARSGLRVLVIDDSPSNRLVLVRQLERLGCHPVEADGGQRALDLVDGTHLVFLDWQMPDMDGIATARALRDAGYSGPIVGLTGTWMPDGQACEFAEAVDSIITKPADLRDIRQAIDERCSAADTPMGGEHSTANATGPARDGADDEPTDGQRSRSQSTSAQGGWSNPAHPDLLLETFADELVERGARLVAGLSPGGDPLVSRREAHALRPSAELFDHHDLAAACAAIENPGDSWPLDPAVVATMIDAVVRELRRELNRRSENAALPDPSERPTTPE